MFSRQFSKAVFLAAMLATASCSSSDDEKKPVVGESIFTTKKNTIDKVEAEKLLSDFFSKVPPVIKNDLWIRSGYVPGENLAFSGLNDSRSASFGTRPKQGFQATAPIVAEGRIFTIDGNANLQARSTSNISDMLWETKLVEGEKSKGKKTYAGKIISMFGEKADFLGGSLSYSLGKVYVSTRRGFLMSVDAASGQVDWSQYYKAQIRSTPVVRDGIVMFVTSDNRTIAVDSKDGSEKWVHQGAMERAKVLASPAPVIAGSNIIVTYSSGEIYSLNISNGSEEWGVAPSRAAFGSLSPMFSDISQNPVLHNNVLYVVSSEGTLSAVNMSGAQLWSFEGESISTAPWAVNDILFTTTRFGRLLAISARTGKLLWKANMANPEDIREDNLLFSGVVMAGGKLYSVDNQGTLYAYSPKDGSSEGSLGVDSGIFSSPIVAEGRMYMVTSSANLVEVK